jgi:hypothetical protein
VTVITVTAITVLLAAMLSLLSPKLAHVQTPHSCCAAAAIAAAADGYPSPAAFDRGCIKLNSTVRHSTEAMVRPAIGTGMFRLPVEYSLSGCVGQSGGRVNRGGSGGFAYGIQTYGETRCVLDKKGSPRGMTGVTQLSMSATRCGVCVSCLIGALEKGNGTSSGNGSSSSNGTQAAG